ARGTRIKHSVAVMVSQRVHGLALGCEDLNDHEQLRQDPMLKLLAGQPHLEAPAPGKNTLNRLEFSTGTPDRYKKITFWKASIKELLVDVFLEDAPQLVSAGGRAGCGHYRCGIARQVGRPVLPRLLRRLLLLAAVCLL